MQTHSSARNRKPTITRDVLLARIDASAGAASRKLAALRASSPIGRKTQIAIEAASCREEVRQGQLKEIRTQESTAVAMSRFRSVSTTSGHAALRKQARQDSEVRAAHLKAAKSESRAWARNHGGR